MLKHNKDGTCDLSVRVVCSAGTYVRFWPRGSAKASVSGAHLAACDAPARARSASRKTITLKS